MIVTFTAEQLDEMCKTRPEGYRADVLAVSAAAPGGGWQMDAGSEAYLALKKKYAPPSPTPRIAAALAAKYKGRHPVGPGRSQPSSELRQLTVRHEDIYKAGDALCKVFAGADDFARAYQLFKAREAAGGCRTCSRGRELRKVYMGFKTSLAASSDEVRLEVRNMFADTQYLEVMPQALKWDDIVKPPLN